MSTHTTIKHSLWKRFRRVSTVFLLSVIVFFSGMDLAKSQDSQLQGDSVLAEVISEKKESDKDLMSINFTNVTLEKALEILADRINVGFSYNPDVMPNKIVSFEMSNVQAHEVIYKLLEGSNLEPVLPPSRDVIILREKEVRINSEILQVTVTGVVTDAETGDPLPGVNIILQGSPNVGTSTNLNGEYTLEVPSLDTTLVFTYIGYQEQVIPIDGRSTVDVELERMAVSGDELVVVGYGTARLRDFTGSVSRVNVEDSPVSLVPSTNALQSLRQTTPGLNVGPVNTAGGSSSLLVRGQNSINGSNQPLIVVDDVVYLGSINDINPSDIATVNVLKDASAAAIYGSRASNGVIMFTTKRGKTDKPTLTFSSSSGIYHWNTKPEMMSPERYIERANLFLGVDGPESWMFPNELYNYENGRTTKWMDLFSRTGRIYDNQISVSGDRNNINYYVSAGYQDQKGVIVGDDYDRISLRTRINTDVTEWLKINLDGTFNRSDYSGRGAQWGNLFFGENYYSPYRGDGEDKLLEKWPRGETRPGNVSDNPLWRTQDSVADDIDQRDSYRLSSFALVEFPFLEGLSYRVNFATNIRQFKQEQFIYESNFVQGGSMFDLSRYSPQAMQSQLSLANGRVTDRNISNYVVDNIVTYAKDLNLHRFDVTLVATRDYQSDRSFTNTGSDFLDNGNTELGIDGLPLASNQFLGNNHIEFSNVGYLARLNYTFKDRYHFNASFRRDGSSVFGEDKKFGNFPSVGLGWTLSEENFLSEINFISNLRLRASYGLSGNQGVSAYETLARVNSGQPGGIRYQWGNQPGVTQYGLAIAALGNDQLGWETTTSLNVGLEASLLQNRVIMDFNFYMSETKDQLFVREIPIMTGFSSIRASLGQVDNRGVELSLRTINVENSNLTWSSNLTFWQNRNELSKLYGDGEDDLANNLFVGESLGAIYGFEWTGIVQENDTEYIESTGARPGDAKFKDLNGDGRLTFDQDRKILGYTKPNFSLNLSNTLSYKDFEFYLHLSGIFGGGNYYLQSNRQAFLSGTEQHTYHPLEKISYWTPENPSNKYPSPFYNEDRFLGLQSRSFVRIQDVVLSYNLPSTTLSHLNISRLRVYLSAQNLYTISGWDGEPEAGTTAISTTYPVPANYSLGFDITF